MSGRYHRDIGPILQIFRSFVRGRSWNEQNRRPDNLSVRPYPPHNPAPGPSDKTSFNYYHTRDARRMVSPPISLVNNTAKQISSGDAVKSGSKSAPKPGVVYNWD